MRSRCSQKRLPIGYGDTCMLSCGVYGMNSSVSGPNISRFERDMKTYLRYYGNGECGYDIVAMAILDLQAG